MLAPSERARTRPRRARASERRQTLAFPPELASSGHKDGAACARPFCRRAAGRRPRCARVSVRLRGFSLSLRRRSAAERYDISTPCALADLAMAPARGTREIWCSCPSFKRHLRGNVRCMLSLFAKCFAVRNAHLARPISAKRTGAGGRGRCWLEPTWPRFDRRLRAQCPGPSSADPRRPWPQGAPRLLADPAAHPTKPWALGAHARGAGAEDPGQELAPARQLLADAALIPEGRLARVSGGRLDTKAIELRPRRERQGLLLLARVPQPTAGVGMPSPNMPCGPASTPFHAVPPPPVTKDACRTRPSSRNEHHNNGIAGSRNISDHGSNPTSSYGSRGHLRFHQVATGMTAHRDSNPCAATEGILRAPTWSQK